MSVCKRTENGHVRYLCKYKDEDGRWRQRSFKSESDARAFDDEMSYEAPENKRLTVLECVVAFIQAVPHCAIGRRGYEVMMLGHERKDGTRFVGPGEFLADKYADTLDRRDLENFRAACRQNGNAEATVQKYEEKLRAALVWCANEGLIPANPWANFHGLRGVQHKSRDGEPEDFARIYSVLPPALQWACRTCIALCLRPGGSELGSLTWGSIDLAHGLARVYMSKVRRTKTVYPPQWWLDEAKLRRGDDDDYVCRSPRGKRLSTLVLWSHWLKACRAVDVHMPPYAMRHIAASSMMEAGADPISIAAQLGHSNVTTTVRYYAHVRAKKQIEAARALVAPGMVHLVRLVRKTDTETQ
ncbi:MAG: tyrosine-type recombinase/integrase [Desulfovibrio sp.]|nr:tyrosine-type recombinase/integrase [Desulfovibrio sp.]